MIRLGSLLHFPDAFERPEEQDHPNPLRVKTTGPRDREGWLIATDRLGEVRDDEREAA